MKIGAAWVRKTQDGKNYLSCTIQEPFQEPKNFALFKNEQKEKDNQPDYNIVWSENPKPKQGYQSDPFDDDIPI